MKSTLGSLPDSVPRPGYGITAGGLPGKKLVDTCLRDGPLAALLPTPFSRNQRRKRAKPGRHSVQGAETERPCSKPVEINAHILRGTTSTLGNSGQCAARPQRTGSRMTVTAAAIKGERLSKAPQESPAHKRRPPAAPTSQEANTEPAQRRADSPQDDSSPVSRCLAHLVPSSRVQAEHC